MLVGLATKSPNSWVRWHSIPTEGPKSYEATGASPKLAVPTLAGLKGVEAGDTPSRLDGVLVLRRKREPPVGGAFWDENMVENGSSIASTSGAKSTGTEFVAFPLAVAFKPSRQAENG